MTILQILNQNNYIINSIVIVTLTFCLDVADWVLGCHSVEFEDAVDYVKAFLFEGPCFIHGGVEVEKMGYPPNHL